MDGVIPLLLMTVGGACAKICGCGVGLLSQQEENVNVKGKSLATEFLFISLITDLSGLSLLETS